LITSVSFVGRWRLKLTFSAIDIGLGALLHGCISICCPNSNPQSPTPTPTPHCPCNPTPNRTRLLHLFVYLAGIVFQFQGSASVRPSVHLSVCLSVCLPLSLVRFDAGLFALVCGCCCSRKAPQTSRGKW